MTASPPGLPSPGLLSVTGYVLAGGRSSRMGQDKAFLQVEGETLLESALRRLQLVCGDVAILSGPLDPDRDAALSCYARLVPDTDAMHQGPLAALAVALTACTTEYALLLAVDQPALPAAALHQFAEAGIGAGAAAACFACHDTPQPLPLLVSRTLLPLVQRALDTGERRLLPSVQSAAAEIGRDLLVIPAPPATSALFLNLNTPADLAQWRTVSNHSAP